MARKQRSLRTNVRGMKFFIPAHAPKSTRSGEPLTQQHCEERTVVVLLVGAALKGQRNYYLAPADSYRAALAISK